jgi:hypothetical protein
VLTKDRPCGVEPVLAANLRCLGVAELVRMPAFQTMPIAGDPNGVADGDRIVSFARKFLGLLSLTTKLTRLDL